MHGKISNEKPWLFYGVKMILTPCKLHHLCKLREHEEKKPTIAEKESQLLWIMLLCNRGYGTELSSENCMQLKIRNLPPRFRIKVAFCHHREF